jgi:hypothetical protein
MLRVVYAVFDAECRMLAPYAECRYAKCCRTVCHGATGTDINLRVKYNNPVNPKPPPP